MIVCGVGKSGIVARKIAATLSSTGTPAVYLHPGDAVHGDMGMITKDDIFLAVSKSGQNDDIMKLLPYLKRMKVRMIAITAKAECPLARESEIVLLTMAEKEACPMDVVPTTSTTAAMVLGDALAVAAFQSRNFSKEDFARLHPSGVLGKRLSLTVGELMHKGDAMPLIGADTLLREALFEITNKRLGCAGITDGEGTARGHHRGRRSQAHPHQEPARARDEGVRSHDLPAAHDARGRSRGRRPRRRWRWIRAAP